MTTETPSTPESVATTPATTPTPPPATPPRGPDGKFLARAASTPPTDQPGGATTDHPPADTPPGDASETPPTEPKRSRAAERINQLVAEKHAALREAAALRRQLEALQKAPTPRVDPDDFDGQQRESVRAVLREETSQRTEMMLQEALQRAHEAQVATFSAKVEAARERIPDIDRSLETFARLPLSQHAAEILVESDRAAEIAHYLAHNPREAYDIYHMTPAQQGRALALIEQRVSLPARRTSATPPPPPTVTGAGAPREKSPQEMSADEYIAWRKATWAKGGR